MIDMGITARAAAHGLAQTTTHIKNTALKAMAAAIRYNAATIKAANQLDIKQLQSSEFSPAFIDRLTLNSPRIDDMALGLEKIAELSDPVGSLLSSVTRPNGLIINRVCVPIGVIGVIYESRPNVTADAAGLCLKAGNAVILRGGSESFQSSQAILSALQTGLSAAGLPAGAIQMLPTAERSALHELLTMDNYIDVIIPRGGPQLLNYVSATSRIPVFKHLAGLCHTYLHRAADLAMARKIVLNAKMRRPGICGATEVLLIDADIAAAYLPLIITDLMAADCEIRGDAPVIALDSRVKLAQPEDYDTEFLEAIIAIKIVKDISVAIAHIGLHSTQHTDAIITDDLAAAEKFLNEVDSAIVIHNASTQFADGGEFGMGAEIGIATGKLHARGPVGVEQLTTFKYQLHGSGQIRS